MRCLGRRLLLSMPALLSLVLAASGQAQDDKAPPKIIVKKDVVYGNVHGAGLLADVAYPEGKGPFPVILSVHGGRWVGSSRTDAGEGAIDVLRWAGFGFFAMTIDYRLAGCTPPPACYQDVQCAIRWVHAHADKFPIDPKRVILIGMSAGGHLVSLAATLGEGPFPRTGGWPKHPANIRGVISLSAPYDLETLSWGNLWKPGGGDALEARRLASPIQHVSAATTPLLILHSDNDGSVPLQQALDMAQALEKANARHRLSVHKRKGHMRITEEVLKESLAFIEEISKEKKKADEAEARKPPAAPEKIIYWESASDDHRLTAISLTDKKTQRLTKKLAADQIQADWPMLLSPDGKWAAFPGTKLAGDDDASEGIVQVRPLDKPDAKPRSLEVKGTPVCWSPDGKQLIVTDFDDETLPQTLVDVASGKRTALKVPEIKTAKDDVPFVTDWSPDGKSWLVVMLSGNQNPRPKLYLTRSDGSEPQHLKHLGHALVARFSPDGKQVLYLGLEEKNPEQLFVADVKPSKPMRISQAMNGGILEFDFCWSPDGKRVAYVWQNSRQGEDAEAFLMVVDRDGRNEQVLTSVKGAENRLGSPNWR